MAKLISKNMSEVAYRALSNSMKTTGHPESTDYLVEYDFLCLQTAGVVSKLSYIENKDLLLNLNIIKRKISKNVKKLRMLQFS